MNAVPARAGRESLSPETLAVVVGRPAPMAGEPVNPPIVLSSAYVHAEGEPEFGDLAHGREGNSTWSALQQTLGALEGGYALVFASGMAATDAVLNEVPVGGTLVLDRGAHADTLRLADRLRRQGRLQVRAVDVTDITAVAAAAQGADLVWLELPSSPLLDVADLPAVVSAAHAGGARVVVDSTGATPVSIRPLEHGADLVLHSVSKYLGGHSDLHLGAVISGRGPDGAGCARRLMEHRSLHGATAGPFEAWLALRGIRTLAVRMERAQASALELARRLQRHPAVVRVHHPGLPEHPGHETAGRLLAGYGALIGLEVDGGAEAAERVAAATRVWVHAGGFGGVESSLQRHRRQAEDDDHVPHNLLRLSVGIEHLEDLWTDLDAALRTILIDLTAPQACGADRAAGAPSP